jgi:tristetraprolin/butyrate response factor 1
LICERRKVLTAASGQAKFDQTKKMEDKRKIQQSSNDFEMSSLFVPISRMNNCQLGGYGPPEKNPEKNPRYKTEICRNFKERSNCIYGKKCQFAHGRQELCDVRKSKYKTKPCQKYWQVGYCAYGPRCNFLHGEINDFDQEMLDLNTTITRGDSTHYDPTLSSTSRPTTPTNLFEFELGDDPTMPREPAPYANLQAKPAPRPNFESNDFDIGIWQPCEGQGVNL